MTSETQKIISHVNIFNLATKKARTIYSQNGIHEAPNWSRDGSYLVINHAGSLYRLSVDGNDEQAIDSGFADRCNNDHGISPDGKQLVISHHRKDHNGGSIIYILPIDGGEPQQVTDAAPSYWHGWSPDGSRLAYVATRGEPDLKIYSINVDGSDEKCLTFGPGLDDGPDYSPCGNYIYYNSFASGRMQIWRMRTDGSEHQQIVFSEGSDWFAHPSPNGKDCVFIRYIKDQAQAHPFGCDVMLMHLDIPSGNVAPLTEVFYGGQGSLNVPSWSPDGREFAFVRYEQNEKKV